ncbi:MAG: hypothetical protein ACFFBD_29480, partial [Candidatus Hodarchaeota archaeon]
RFCHQTYPGSIVQKPQCFLPSRLKFDRVLLDTPCTASGLMRRYKTHIKKWHYHNLEPLLKRQKKLLSHAIKLLKPEGVLVYSTCSIEPEENESNIQFALDTHTNIHLEDITIIKNFKTREGLTSWQDKVFSPEMKKTMRIYPQDEGTEGFFIARIRKVE